MEPWRTFAESIYHQLFDHTGPQPPLPSDGLLLTGIRRRCFNLSIRVLHETNCTSPEYYKLFSILASIINLRDMDQGNRLNDGTDDDGTELDALLIELRGTLSREGKYSWISTCNMLLEANKELDVVPSTPPNQEEQQQEHHSTPVEQLLSPFSASLSLLSSTHHRQVQDQPPPAPSPSQQDRHQQPQQQEDQQQALKPRMDCIKRRTTLPNILKDSVIPRRPDTPPLLPAEENNKAREFNTNDPSSSTSTPRAYLSPSVNERFSQLEIQSMESTVDWVEVPIPSNEDASLLPPSSWSYMFDTTQELQDYDELCQELDSIPPPLSQVNNVTTTGSTIAAIGSSSNSQDHLPPSQSTPRWFKTPIRPPEDSPLGNQPHQLFYSQDWQEEGPEHDSESQSPDVVFFHSQMSQSQSQQPPD
ncbi:hypothetical protein BG004_004566 [Podila humilis]|nr:hypothetical protein BG004_004566 [Podila humilis]